MPALTPHQIGYLVPEFPGQTHNFFWREIGALGEIGMDALLLSTRRPPKGIESPTWAAQALGRTMYLFPQPMLRVLSDVAWVAVRPAAAWRVLEAILRADVQGFRARLGLFGLALMGVRMSRYLKAHGVQHVHVHSCANSAHIAMFAHLVGDLSYSLTLHNRLIDHGPNQAEKWRHARFAIVISDWVEQDLRERLGALLPPLLRAPMGVDTEKFKRSGEYAMAPPGQPLHLFSCARLNPVKGHLDAIAAMSALRSRGHDARLTIAGEDDAGGSGYRHVIEARIRELGVERCVTLLGAVSEDEVVGHLQRSHIFILASLAEPLGVALMEAMAMELPVIATRAGGVPEMVRDGLEGVLVPPAMPTALADALERLARDPAHAKALGVAARRCIEQRFSHRRSAQAIVAGLSDASDANVARAAVAPVADSA
jgi:glycosyltransferase involved in cell wall biosynthesis